MDCVKSEFDDLCITEDAKNASRMDKRKHIDAQDDDDDDDQDRKYISKNLNAERRRRKKLSDRQLELRSLMNKATIITDAITYIEELQKSVEDLTDQLHQMEATSVAEEKPNFKEIDADQEMNKWGLAPEVQVNHIGGTKFWIKIVFRKKRGGLTKLMEAINVLGFDITDTSITTSDGAVLVTLSAEGIHGGLSEADKIKKFLLEVISTI
ncbi:UNVERIFIED_CONTAM: Transcription factor DYT1 [Sesamum radiatum]|uniref:Transcription factor DYT1 n=1 Tax=Sesamum radiatum TaxID=300843 RepID=A0AAW2T2R8_SESRA